RLRDRVRDEDRVLVADRLAQTARHAGSGVDLGDLVEGLLARVVDQGAVDDRRRDVARLDLLDELALLVLDTGDRAVSGADRAVDAAIRVDDVLLVLVTRDRVRRALDLADSAADARFGDEMRHSPS